MPTIELFSTIAIVSIVSIVISLKLRIPTVVGLLLAGLAIGPYGFGLITQQDLGTIDIFAEIGGILLLFFVGMEFSISKIKKLGTLPVFATLIEVGTIFLLTYETSLFLGFSQIAATFLGIVLSNTSTGISLKILKDMKLVSREEVPFLVAVSIIEDISAIFMLTMLTSVTQVTTFSIVTSIIKAIFFFSLTLLFLPKIIQLGFQFIGQHLNDEVIQFSAIGTAMLLSYISFRIGFSPAIGSFLAGSVISSMPQSQKIENSVRHFSLIFLALFFLSIGTTVDYRVLITNFSLTLIFLIVAVVGKFTGVSVGSYLLGFSGESAIFTATAMIPMGEISLYISRVGVSIGVLSNEIFSTISFLVLATSMLSLPLIKKNESIFHFFNFFMPSSLKKMGRNISTEIGIIRSEFQPQEGSFLSLLGSKIKDMVINSFFILIPIPFVIYAVDTLGFDLLLTSIAYAIFISRFLYKFLTDIGAIMNRLSEMFTRSFRHKETSSRIFHDFFLSTILFVVAFFVSPIVLGYLSLQILTFQVSILLLFFSFVFLWDGSKNVNRLVKQRMRDRGPRFRYKRR